MPNIEQVIAKYIELRDRKAALAKKQSEEMAPIGTAMEQIENYLLHTMNTLGCDSLKAAEVGTAFKAVLNSCQLQDPVEFKKFVFKPAVDNIISYLQNSGYSVRDIDHEAIANILRDLAKWDMVDFRAGKKGIAEYVANENGNVPGVAINSITTVNIRRA